MKESDPGPSQETSPGNTHHQEHKAGTMAGGGPEIRDSDKGSCRPSPSQGHPAQPWTPGAGCDCHSEPGTVPWLTSHCSGAPCGCTWGRNQGSALCSSKGGKQGWVCLPGHARWPSMQSGLFYHSILFWASRLKPDWCEHQWSSLGGRLCVCVSERDSWRSCQEQNLKDPGRCRPPPVIFWEAGSFLTRLPSKRQSRTCRLSTRTPVPGRGIILQLHKVTIRDTLVGLGWIWNTAEGGSDLQGTWSHFAFMDWGDSPSHKPSAVTAAGFLHKPLALPQTRFSGTDRRSQQKKCSRNGAN